MFCSVFCCVSNLNVCTWKAILVSFFKLAHCLTNIGWSYWAVVIDYRSFNVGNQIRLVSTQLLDEPTSVSKDRSGKSIQEIKTQSLPNASCSFCLMSHTRALKLKQNPDDSITGHFCSKNCGNLGSKVLLNSVNPFFNEKVNWKQNVCIYIYIYFFFFTDIYMAKICDEIPA